MGQTTITVKEETLERFNDTKKTPEGEVEPSADLFLKSLLDAWDAADEEVYTDKEAVYEPDRREPIQHRENNVENDLMEEHFPERKTQEDVQEAKREILNRLDDLQSQLPNDVATEIHK